MNNEPNKKVTIDTKAGTARFGSDRKLSVDRLTRGRRQTLSTASLLRTAPAEF